MFDWLKKLIGWGKKADEKCEDDAPVDKIKEEEEDKEVIAKKFILKGDTFTEDVRLDRVEMFDKKSREFPVSWFWSKDKKPIRSYTWRCKKHLNQGLEGACHVEGTEILTEDGWKDWRDVRKTDSLATVNQGSQKLEWQVPEKLISYEYEGPIVVSNNRNVKFAVTPDHRMYVRKWNEAERTLDVVYDFVTADELGWYTGLMSAPIGQECSEPSISVSDLAISMEIMAPFLGIFLAEGCLYYAGKGNYRIEIAAVKPSCRELVYELVAALGLNVCVYEDRYTIHNKSLFEFLTPYYNGGALNKLIPDMIKNAADTNIDRFLDAFCLGDGHTTSEGRRFFYTSSRQLADDLQELCLRRGIRSAVLTREPRDAFIEGRHIPKENIHESYVVSPWRKDNLSLDRKSQITTEDYKGMVYCATVPNSTLVTRYKGTILISGNCVGFGICHELSAKPVEVQGLTNRYAREKIYWEAQKIDNMPGGAYPGAERFYEGTSVLAGVKIAHALGYFDSYRWAFSLEDLQLGIGYNGPAVLGLPWFEGMINTDKKGYIHPTGKKIGGHCILSNAVDIVKDRFTLHNSWGKAWGINGTCYISFEDMKKLLDLRGEAVFFERRHIEKTPKKVIK